MKCIKIKQYVACAFITGVLLVTLGTQNSGAAESNAANVAALLARLQAATTQAEASTAARVGIEKSIADAQAPLAEAKAKYETLSANFNSLKNNLDIAKTAEARSINAQKLAKKHYDYETQQVTFRSTVCSNGYHREGGNCVKDTAAPPPAIPVAKKLLGKLTIQNVNLGTVRYRARSSKTVTIKNTGDGSATGVKVLEERGWGDCLHSYVHTNPYGFSCGTIAPGATCNIEVYYKNEDPQTENRRGPGAARNCQGTLEWHDGDKRQESKIYVSLGVW